MNLDDFLINLWEDCAEYVKEVCFPPTVVEYQSNLEKCKKDLDYTYSLLEKELTRAETNYICAFMMGNHKLRAKNLSDIKNISKALKIISDIKKLLQMEEEL